jgi:cytochrome c556
MKKIILSFIAFAALASSLYAYSQEDRIRDMRTMADALADMQKGILYNNKELVHTGVVNLKKASENIEIAPKTDMDYSSVFAKREAENIEKYANRVNASMQEGKKHSALTNYTKVMNQCISCHNKLRKWNQ